MTEDAVLVTGANGFVGQHLCTSLVQDCLQVRALTRSDAASIESRLKWVCGDVRDRSVAKQAVQGVNSVVHLAARAHILRDVADPLSQFRAVNVDATRQLFEEASAAGVEHFVFISSVGAVCSASVEVVSEETAPRPSTPYGQSKLEAELSLCELAVRTNTKLTILRPPAVYGAGQKGNFARLCNLVVRGVPLPLAMANAPRSLIYVGNLVAAIRAVLVPQSRQVRTFFVADAEQVSTATFIRETAAAHGRAARLVPVPTVMLHALGTMGSSIRRWVDFPVNADLVERLLAPLRIDASLIEREVGFRPPKSLRDGLREMAIAETKEVAA